QQPVYLPLDGTPADQVVVAGDCLRLQQRPCGLHRRSSNVGLSQRERKAHGGSCSSVEAEQIGGHVGFLRRGVCGEGRKFEKIRKRGSASVVGQPKAIDAGRLGVGEEQLLINVPQFRVLHRLGLERFNQAVRTRTGIGQVAAVAGRGRAAAGGLRKSQREEIGLSGDGVSAGQGSRWSSIQVLQRVR